MLLLSYKGNSIAIRTLTIMTNMFFFIIGLIFFLTGQLLLAQGNGFVYSQEPIDFAHWFLLIVVVCLIPKVVSFPKNTFSIIGIPLTLTGID